MADLEPALTVDCPTCFVKPGEPCRSHHAVSLHVARRRALADLEKQASRFLGALTEEEIEAARSPAGGWSKATLAGWGVPWPPPKGWRHRLVHGNGSRVAAKSAPVLFGHTGPENPIPETVEYWPPWEDPPVPGCLAESGIPVTGLVWCPVHRDYEELREGVPVVRLEAS